MTSSRSRSRSGRFLLVAAAAGLVAGLALGSSPAVAVDCASGARTLYVRAGAAGGGIGSLHRPFPSLATVSNAARAGDTIVVLPSGVALNGGIALKRGQTLLGAGPEVAGLTAGAPAPTVTNSSAALSGDAVRLADSSTVRNLRIVNARRGAVYGDDVSDVRVTGNDISGQNTGCTVGYVIPNFILPTVVPRIGVPIPPPGLTNGWAGIMLDGHGRTAGTVRIDHNVVHDATCGDGIDVRLFGTSRYTALIDHNVVRDLGQGPLFLSLLAIGFQTSDAGVLTATAEGNLTTDLASGPAGALADSEGVFVNVVNKSKATVRVHDHVHTNPDRGGGFSANGLEAVTIGDGGGEMTVNVSDSIFTGTTGDVVEEGALSTGAKLVMTLDNVVAQRSSGLANSGLGNTGLLPVNNADCIVAGSLGQGNDISLTVRQSILRECANNGISVGSNVVRPAISRGSTTRLSLDVDRSTITGNKGGNISSRNYTGVDTLRARIAHSDLRGSQGTGSAQAALVADNLAPGSRGTAILDAGGGAAGSPGGNCISGTPLSAEATDYAVSARGNWWGRAGGPTAQQTATALGGRLDTGDALASEPDCGRNSSARAGVGAPVEYPDTVAVTTCAGPTRTTGPNGTASPAAVDSAPVAANSAALADSGTESGFHLLAGIALVGVGIAYLLAGLAPAGTVRRRRSR